MSYTEIHSLTSREIEDNATQVMKIVIEYIIDNNITIEELSKDKDNLAVIVRKPSWWKHIFSSDKDEHLTYTIIKRLYK